MPDQFTQRTRRVMTLANDIALRHGLASLTDLAVLVAILEENGGVAATILRECDFELGSLYRHLPSGQTDLGVRHLTQPPPASPECERTLQAAERIAAEYGAAQVGTEHLLVAMTRSTESPAAHLLASHGVTEPVICEVASRFA